MTDTQTPLILDLMQQHGLTQRAMGLAAGVQRTAAMYHYRRLEAGECRLSLEQMQAVADWLAEETGERYAVEELFSVRATA